jgi:hypothetical protein
MSPKPPVTAFTVPVWRMFYASMISLHSSCAAVRQIIV